MAEALLGWTIKDWTIRPSLVAILNLADYRWHDVQESKTHFAKLLFSAPSRIEFSDLDRSHGALWPIEEITSGQHGNSAFCRITLKDRGRITIQARSQQLFFW